MSADAVAQVWANPQPTPAAQLVMVAVAWRANDRAGGVAAVSQATLADMTGLPRRTLRRVIDDLAGTGALTVVWATPGARTRYLVTVGNRAMPTSVADLASTPAEQLALPLDDPRPGDNPGPLDAQVFNSRATLGGPRPGHLDGPRKRKEEEEEPARPVADQLADAVARHWGSA
jgi:hypothetical protein